MYDIPKTEVGLHNADDIALLESDLNYVEIQQTLTNGLADMERYLQRWRLYDLMLNK